MPATSHFSVLGDPLLKMSSADHKSVEINRMSSSATHQSKQKGSTSNVQVILRARPLSDKEKANNVPIGLTADCEKKEVNVAVAHRNMASTKTYSFDSVYNQFSKQKEVIQSTTIIRSEPILASSPSGN